MVIWRKQKFDIIILRKWLAHMSHILTFIVKKEMMWTHVVGSSKIFFNKTRNHSQAVGLQPSARAVCAVYSRLGRHDITLQTFFSAMHFQPLEWPQNEIVKRKKSYLNSYYPHMKPLFGFKHLFFTSTNFSVSAKYKVLGLRKFSKKLPWIFETFQLVQKKFLLELTRLRF